jgi:hypothetical protein
MGFVRATAADHHEFGVRNICGSAPARFAFGGLGRQKIVGPAGCLASERGGGHDDGLSGVHMVSGRVKNPALKRILLSRKF